MNFVLENRQQAGPNIASFFVTIEQVGNNFWCEALL